MAVPSEKMVTPYFADAMGLLVPFQEWILRVARKDVCVKEGAAVGVGNRLIKRCDQGWMLANVALITCFLVMVIGVGRTHSSRLESYYTRRRRASGEAVARLIAKLVPQCFPLHKLFNAK